MVFLLLDWHTYLFRIPPPHKPHESRTASYCRRYYPKNYRSVQSDYLSGIESVASAIRAWNITRMLLDTRGKTRTDRPTFGVTWRKILFSVEIAGPPLSAYRNEERKNQLGCHPTPVVCNTRV